MDNSLSQIDKKYLVIQFNLKIHEMNATEFQNFFANIMTKAYRDFVRIRPYGNLGDGGNDGYRPVEGIYYQVYSPMKPEEKDSEAILKLKQDFNKAKHKWVLISQITEFNLVYNDKNRGSNIVLEKGLVDLQKENINIRFNLFLVKDLLLELNKLQSEDLVYLGFDSDTLDARKIQNSLISHLEIELDRLNSKYVEHAVSVYSSLITQYGDEEITTYLEALKCKLLFLNEKVEDAVSMLNDLYTRYPNNFKLILLYIEYYRRIGDINMCEEFISKVNIIDKENWQLEIMTLAINYDKNNLITIPDFQFLTKYNNHIKASFYRWYSLFEEKYGSYEQAMVYIERAIHFDPDRLINYLIKLTLLVMHLEKNINQESIAKFKQFYQPLNHLIEDKFDTIFSEHPRYSALYYYSKIRIGFLIGEYNDLAQLVIECIQNSIMCYLDKSIDEMLSYNLPDIDLSESDFTDVLIYIRNNANLASESLMKSLLIQFLIQHDLDSAYKYFTEIEFSKMADLISAIQ